MDILIISVTSLVRKFWITLRSLAQPLKVRYNQLQHPYSSLPVMQYPNLEVSLPYLTQTIPVLKVAKNHPFDDSSIFPVINETRLRIFSRIHSAYETLEEYYSLQLPEWIQCR